MNSLCLHGSSVLAALSLLCAGCSAPEGPLKLESRMDVDLKGALKLEGPITIQIQGPTIHYEGTQISDELLDRVKPGKTTEEWVLAVFGEPTARAELRDGSAILRWTYRPLDQQGSLVQFFGGSTEKEPKLASQTVFVQVKDGVVTDKWKG